MKLLFKSAVGLAVAGACNFALAATINGPATANDVSLEFLKAKAAETSTTTQRVTLPILSFVTGASYAANDELTLTISSGDFSLNGSTHSDVACGADGSGQFTLQFMNTSGRNATFRVSSLSGTTTGKSCAFGSLAVLAGSYTGAAPVTMASSAKVATTGSAFDVTTAKPYFSVKAELTAVAAVTQFNGTVDYAAKLGRAFTINEDNLAGAGSADRFTVGITRLAAGTFANTATFTSVKFAVTAPKGLSFMNLGGTTCEAAPTSGSALSTGKTSAVSAGSTVALTGTDCGTVSFVNTTGPASGDTLKVYGFSIGTSATSPTVGPSIQPQAFGTTTVTVEYNTGAGTASSSTVSSAIDVGTWISNGQAAVIPYMPSNTSATNKKDVVVYITNRSSVTGTATATVYGHEVGANNVIIEKSATSACTVNLGTIAPNSTTNVSATLRTGIDTCWGAGKDYRVAVEVQTTLPTNSTTVYSGFTVGTDRVSVINDTNGK